MDVLVFQTSGLSIVFDHIIWLIHSAAVGCTLDSLPLKKGERRNVENICTVRTALAH